MNADTRTDAQHAKVTGARLHADNCFIEVETEVEVWKLTRRFCDPAEVEFTLTWGKKGRREFTVYGDEDVRAIARVSWPPLSVLSWPTKWQRIP